MTIYVNRWQWREMLASELSSLSSTTRLVLLAISLHMNAEGQNAWPSEETLAIRTGLTTRSISKHVKLAQRDGWLEITKRRRPGQGWNGNQYRAIVPAHLQNRIPVATKHKERGSASLAKHTEFDKQTYRTIVQNDLNEVPTNSSLTSTRNGDHTSSSERISVSDAYERELPPVKFRGPVQIAMLEKLKQGERKKKSGEQPK